MRVVTNAPERSFDCVVVIPSCKEGKAIMGTLDSFAIQKLSASVRCAVLVIVNHRSDATQEVVESNRVTLDLLEGNILYRRNSKELSTEGFFLMLRYGFEAAEQRSIFWDRIILVDATSPGGELENCNVGVARAAGTEIAMKYLDPNGLNILGCADADNVYSRDYVQSGVSHLIVHPEVSAVKGVWEHEKGPINNMITLNAYVGDIADNIALRRSAIFLKTSSSPIIPGSSGFFRRAMYELTGGFQPLSFGEDSDLSLRILKHGGTIEECRGMVVEVSLRESDRASGGFGRTVTSRYVSTEGYFERIKSMSLSNRVVRRCFMGGIERANAMQLGDDEWMDFVSEQFRINNPEVPQLTTEELQALFQANLMAPPNLLVFSNHFLTNIVANLFKIRSQEVPLPELMNECLHEVFERFPDLEGIYASAISELNMLETGRGTVIREADEKICKNFNENMRSQVRDALGYKISEKDVANRKFAVGIRAFDTVWKIFMYRNSIIKLKDMCIELQRMNLSEHSPVDVEAIEELQRETMEFLKTVDTDTSRHAVVDLVTKNMFCAQAYEFISSVFKAEDLVQTRLVDAKFDEVLERLSQKISIAAKEVKAKIAQILRAVKRFQAVAEKIIASAEGESTYLEVILGELTGSFFWMEEFITENAEKLKKLDKDQGFTMSSISLQRYCYRVHGPY